MLLLVRAAFPKRLEGNEIMKSPLRSLFRDSRSRCLRVVADLYLPDYEAVVGVLEIEITFDGNSLDDKFRATI